MNRAPTHHPPELWSSDRRGRFHIAARLQREIVPARAGRADRAAVDARGRDADKENAVKAGVVG